MKRMFFTLLTVVGLMATSVYAEVATQTNVTKLYIATFDRAPDSAGLDYWVVSSGLSLEGIAQSFFDQDETKTKYPDGYTTEEFIASIYTNLFKRSADTAGSAYWTAELESGNISNSVFILAVVNGAQADDATILENKTEVGLAFAAKGLNDTDLAKSVVADVTASSDTVTSALNIIAVSTATATYADTDFEATDWTDATHSKNVDPNFDEVFDDTQVKRLDIVVTAERWQSMLDDMTATYGAFGGTSTSIPTDAGMPNGGGMPPMDGEMPKNAGMPMDTTTTTLIDSDEDPIFVPADIYYNDKQWYRAGIRFKGNSSLQSSWEAGILKLSLKLDFNEFENEYPQIDNQRFYGFKKFSLKNNYDDSSFLREKVAADVFKQAGMVVSHTAFYRLYVDHGNGAEYFGLYTLVEEVDGTVLDTQFTSDDGNLYKPEDGSTNFVAGTFSEDDFTKKTNEDDADWSDIESLFSILHDSSRTSDASSWRNSLEAVFDVDTFLKYLAVNGIIQNWDTYGRMTHNYYLYNNPDTATLTWIPWDNNEALQEGKMGGSLALDFSDLESSSWPLIAKIYADDVYKAKYDSYMQEVKENVFNATDMQNLYETYSQLVEPYATIERDGYTYLNNSSAFAQAIAELKTHVTTRETAVESYLAQ